LRVDVKIGNDENERQLLGHCHGYILDVRPLSFYEGSAPQNS
jgi:hypothetical protein